MENENTATITCSAGGINSSGKKVYYPPYSKLQSTLYSDFLEDYEDLDLEEINTKDKYFSSGIFKKWLAGIINDEGEAADDVDCEYNFIIKHLSNSYMRVGILVFAFIAFLF